MTTSQYPIGSGFTSASTAAEVVAGVDLTGTLALVTGGYSGIGVETVRALRSAGASVVVPARDRDRAVRALADVGGVEIEPLDLLDPASIDAFAERFLATGRPLHVLVAGAGVMAAPLTRDARGYESQFATNHLGHFQLAARLWPALRRAAGARVVAVSSWAHRRSDIEWDDPNYERRAYDPMDAYGQSKTANVLFAVELDRRGRAEGIRGFALHPGSIVTPLARHVSPDDAPPDRDGRRGRRARHRPVAEPEDRRAGRGDQRLVRHQPAARRSRRGLLREQRHRAARGPTTAGRRRSGCCRTRSTPRRPSGCGP